MTMRIHRAVRTLSLLLALSMLLSVSAISSAAETPAPSVLTGRLLAFTDRRLGRLTLPGTSPGRRASRTRRSIPITTQATAWTAGRSGTTAKEATHCSPWAMQPRRPAAARSP
ncbi:hypothetical protein M5E87_12150 [Flavonifractor plautii]|nr:hypothetical protein M5E87_12150 [Flavonifractor plautii]